MVQLVLCNCPPDAAQPLAQQLVEEGLAACVNIIPNITSIYRWEGELCVDQEHTLLIKTSPERYPELATRLAELHPYSVPEIIALDSAHVASAYQSWVHESLHSK
ncbi:divalent-cation tolerance protein CutA [Lujinxingia litoralis]|uniref:Divalent-cation tolerance protein CutA n=1 Tax=Lujinxingia litoralis TaxID=2211119 RepID=A0A328C4L5_9DELT|nr:divalent-cation tolerance protein CutA [Lujinxingia litoralis]RAL20691.1 divalent-cation tolerance protein CutA [Lujinxingia litoralis]